jgi:multidrug efflux pump subunit AcrB
MLVTGREFDRITLGALILSLGLLVDDAIIAIEMMVVKMEEGLDRVAAATSAWNLTAAPMLSGTLVTIIGFLPIGFAASSAGEYAGNIFWIVAFALIASWFVAVYFTPYLGVKMLPDVTPQAGRSRRNSTRRPCSSASAVDRLVGRQPAGWLRGRRRPCSCSASALLLSPKSKFFPSSDRPELLVEVRMPPGSAIGATAQTAQAIETFLRGQDEAQVVSTYVGAGAPRFFLSLNRSCRTRPSPSWSC